MALNAVAGDGISVRQLLGLRILESAVLTAGANGLDLIVLGAQIAPGGRAEFPIDEGAVLIIDGDRISTDTYFLDLALRWASQAAASMVLVARPGMEIGLAPRRLANRLDIPLVTIDRDTLVIADALREVIAEPERNLAALVVDAVTGLGRISARDGVAGVLRVIDTVLDATSSLVGIEGGVIAGHLLDPPLALRDRIPVFSLMVNNHVVRAIHPIALAINEEPSFWLVTERAAATAFWRRAADTIVRLASRYLSTALLSERLAQERDARSRLGVLNSIVASDGAEPALLQQIGIIGWKVEGWCSAIHIRVVGAGNELLVLARTSELQAVLGRFEIQGALIERPDGWTIWTFDSREPKTEALGALTRNARRSMETFISMHEGMRLAAGIGRPYFGLVGLRRSLAEAQEAATIAQASGGSAVVQHIDELGVERILFGWYSSAEFAEFARTLLRPMLQIDSDGELVRTLEAYLDAESSPTLTAELLGLHRNTVMNRLTKIREVLAVDLEDADQRLAVQLACRVTKLDAR